MSDSHSAPKSLPYPLVLIIGLVLMFGGFYVSKNVPIQFFKDLEEKGIALDPGKTIAVIGVLLILLPVVNTFYLKPLTQAIEERNKALETTFSDAENLRAEMAKMRSDYEAQLTRTEQETREKIQAQVKEAQQMRQQMLNEAATLKEEMVQKAHEEIAREKDKVMNEVRLQVVGLTLGATEKLIGDNLDSDKNRKLIEEFIEKAEVPRA